MITTNQAGNATYLAASTVSRVFAVTAPGTTQAMRRFTAWADDPDSRMGSRPMR